MYIQNIIGAGSNIIASYTKKFIENGKKVPYTQQLAEMCTKTCIPYGSELVKKGNELLGNQRDVEKVSKRQENARITTAKQIHRAVKEGKLDPSYEEKAKNMKRKGKKQLAEINYADRQYTLLQVGKSSSALNYFIPGSGSITSAVTTLGTVKNLTSYASEAPTYIETAAKVSKDLLLPIALSVTAPIWTPLVVPLVAPLAGVTAAGVVATAIAADGICYLYTRNNNNGN
jgi:hypothetical protein